MEAKQLEPLKGQHKLPEAFWTPVSITIFRVVISIFKDSFMTFMANFQSLGRVFLMSFLPKSRRALTTIFRRV